MSPNEINASSSGTRYCSVSAVRLPCRTVNFPADHSLGTAYLRAPLPPAAAPRRSRRCWSAQWGDAGPAQGTLDVPAGHQLKLQATTCWDPDAFGRLGHGDVQALRLSGREAPHILGLVGHLAGLEALDLWAAPVGDDSVASLCGLLGLRSLNLWGTQMTDAAMAYLPAMPRLRNLTVPGRNVGDAAMVDLAAMAMLRVLDLSGSRVSDEGLAMLSASRSIIRLCLWGTAITDAGLPALGRFPALREVDLGGTAVTDAGLVHLTGLGLQRLSLRDTLVSPDGICQVRELMPGCRVDPSEGAYCHACRTQARSGPRRAGAGRAVAGAPPVAGGSHVLSDE